MEFDKTRVTRNFLCLVERLRPLSSQHHADHSDIFEEWIDISATYHTDEKGQIVSNPEECLCGHSPIRKTYCIHNKTTNQFAEPIGECCIERFFNNQVLLDKLRVLKRQYTKKQRDYRKMQKKEQERKRKFIERHNSSTLKIGKFENWKFKDLFDKQQGYIKWWRKIASEPDAFVRDTVINLLTYDQYRHELNTASVIS
jgi:hypothetical protein